MALTRLRPQQAALPSAEDETSPRPSLRRAIEHREARRADLLTATEAEDRARASLKEAEQHLATFDGVESRIAEHHAETISAGEQPALELPRELEIQRSARRAADDHAAAARGALDLISADVAKARALLRASEHAAGQAADAVLSAEAERLAAELTQARARVWALQGHLKGMTYTWVPRPDGTVGPLRLPHAALVVLANDQPPVHPGGYLVLSMWPLTDGGRAVIACYRTRRWSWPDGCSPERQCGVVSLGVELAAERAHWGGGANNKTLQGSRGFPLRPAAGEAGRRRITWFPSPLPDRRDLSASRHVESD